MAAAALIEPLTDLVIRAGAAILAVNRAAMKVDGKTDGSPVTEADLAADRIIGEGLARLAPEIPSLSEERIHLAQLPYRRQLLPDRSARRHQGIRRRPRRIHRQSGAGDQRGAAARHRRRAGARTDLARHGRPRRRAADAQRRRSAAVEPIRTRPCPPRGKPWMVAVSRSHGDARTEAFIAAGRERCAPSSARRSNSAGWRKARPISIPGCRRPANGMSRRAMRWSPPPAARITDANGAALHFGAGREDFIVPEFIAWGDPQRQADLILLRQALLERGPAGVGVSAGSAADRRRRRRGFPRGRTDRAAGPRSARTAGYRHTVTPRAKIDRIVAAELRAVDLGMGDKGGAVALVAEAPDRAGLGGLEVGRPLRRPGIGEIGDGIEPLDRQARE